MGTQLKYVKVKDLSIIPRHLFEQVKPREFDPDQLYAWGPIILQNPLNLFGAFIDKEMTIRGILWSSFNPLDQKLHVHILSVDKEYFGRGILKEAEGILKKNKKKLNAKGIRFSTSRPKAFEKYFGYKKTVVIMEK